MHSKSPLTFGNNHHNLTDISTQWYGFLQLGNKILIVHRASHYLPTQQLPNQKPGSRYCTSSNHMPERQARKMPPRKPTAKIPLLVLSVVWSLWEIGLEEVLKRCRGWSYYRKDVWLDLRNNGYHLGSILPLFQSLLESFLAWSNMAWMSAFWSLKRDFNWSPE